ncbi:hypothetical protein FIM12_00400 [SAR202 cluster bacterium AD-804-J14_MRT_500m]|nr:hypothetical protein [SAR202 cluster bacterium AD-804-J14_MRT_500m]
MEVVSGNFRLVGWSLAVMLLVIASISCNTGETTSSEDGYDSILGTRDLNVGENRFTFVIASRDGQIIENADVELQFQIHEGEVTRPKFVSTAIYREIKGITPHVHPDSEIHEHIDARGFYVVDNALFDEMGVWSVSFVASSAAGEGLGVRDLAFNVNETSAAISIGARPPATENLIVSDVVSVDELCTRSSDDGMHHFSVSEALEQRKPFVVAWATPMFCASTMCGPVLDAIVRIANDYSPAVNFVHIEPFDLELARNEGRLVASDLVMEWGIASEPWVFVMDSNGQVVSQFEGLVTGDEIRSSLDLILSD